MLISIDSGDPKEIADIKDRIGIMPDKITSNPTSVSRAINRIRIEENRVVSVYDVIKEIRAIVGPAVPISVETLGTHDYSSQTMDAAIFVNEALAIVGWDNNLVVKLPAISEGLEAAKRLHGRVPINFTLIFSLHQAHLAASYGATYASGFVGRIDDEIKNTEFKEEREGMDLIKEMVDYYKSNDIRTMVLTASTRRERHIKLAIMYGSHVITIPPSLFNEIYNTYEDNGSDLFERIRQTDFILPQNPLLPSYNEILDWAQLKPFERKLTEDGVKRFLSDAHSANYSVLG